MGDVRRPKGYVGDQHETIGSDLLAVLRSLQHLGGESGYAPRQILGAEHMERLEKIDPNGWYPIDWLLELMETLDAKLGRYGLIKMGRTLFRLSHEERVLRIARSAADIVNGIDGMYHHANRGDRIGGWRMVRFDDAIAEIEKTTPHHCAMEEGILLQALTAVGASALVSQRECFRKGAPACLFVIQSTGGHWTRS
jgi:hypothetical protein